MRSLRTFWSYKKKKKRKENKYLFREEKEVRSQKKKEFFESKKKTVPIKDLFHTSAYFTNLKKQKELQYCIDK